jgi:DNA recombination protein RmuC
MYIALIILVVVLILIIIGVGIGIFLYIKKNKKQTPTTTSNLELQLQTALEKINEIKNDTEKHKEESIKINHQIEQNNKFTNELNNMSVQIKTGLEAMTKNTIDIPQAAKQIADISKLYTNSKNRGNIGELQLEKILASVFGENHDLYEMQAKVDGGIIDALIKTGEKQLYIDAKFNKDN